MAKKNIIAWEKWIDPYGENIDDFEPGCLKNVQPNGLDDIELGDDGVEEWKGPQNTNEIQNQLKKPIKLLFTPMGIIPMTEDTTPSKVFNFWIGHTNFTINNKIAKLISKTDGVETLDIFTRYRFRVGIGKVFNAGYVRKDINEKLNELLNPQDDK